MGMPQSAICAETGPSGLFLTLTLTGGIPAEGGAAPVRQVAAALPALTAELAERLGEPTLVSALGIGARAWTPIVATRPPSLLAPFEPVADGPRQAPATPADLFLHIHSARPDANFALARHVMRQLGGSVRVVEEITGFRHLGGRDLTGFVDGTENPKGDERAEVALVGDEDPDVAGGSYVSIQRYVHNLTGWDALPVSEQEAAVGRTKDEDEELPDTEKPPSAHIARVVIEEDGKELEVVRHSMPYGTTSECGLFFIAYGRSPQPFRRMLERMVRSDAAGHHDRLLDFTRPVTGASFFTPSLDLLRGL